MSEILHPTNFDPINVIEIGELSLDALAGQKVVKSTSSQGLVAGDYLVVGVRGSEIAEIGQIDTINGEDITLLANLRFKHYRTDPITKLVGSQIKIYRAANVNGLAPADTDFAYLGVVTIDADQLYTPYTDLAGGSGYWYKKTYYNSTSSLETSLADATAVRGGGYGHYASVDDVRHEAGMDNNRYIGDESILEKLEMAESEVNGSLAIAGYTLPLTEVPANLKQITQLLAAGYLLTVDYGPEYNGLTKDGERKIKMGKDMLLKIEKRETQLLDVQGEPVAQTKAVSGYPTSAQSETNPPIFSMTDKW